MLLAENKQAGCEGVALESKSSFEPCFPNPRTHELFTQKNFDTFDAQVKGYAALQSRTLEPEEETIFALICRANHFDACDLIAASADPRKLIRSAAVRSAARDLAILHLAGGNAQSGSDIVERFQLANEFHTVELRLGLARGLIQFMQNENPYPEFWERITCQEQDRETILRYGMCYALAEGMLPEVSVIRAVYGYPDELSTETPFFPPSVAQFLERFEIKTFTALAEFVSKEQLFFRYLVCNPNYVSTVTREDMTVARKLHLNLLEAEEAPPGYLDQTAAEVLVLDLSCEQIKIDKTVRETIGADLTRPPAIEVTGVSYLGPEESLAVARLESLIYENENIRQKLFDLENTLIASAINNSLKGRPSLSMQYRDAEGKIRGYIIAYEGRAGEAKDTPVIYIDDLAADNMIAGGRLLKAFLRLYRLHYLSAGGAVSPPVVAHLREATSYKLVSSSLKRISQDLGINPVIEERESSTEKGEPVRLVWIYPFAPQEITGDSNDVAALNDEPGGRS